MDEDREDTIGLPLHNYLVYSSIKEKFSEAVKGSDFGRIASDAEKLLPELMNLLIDKKYPFLTNEQKKILMEQFNSQGSLDLDFNACFSFYKDSDLFSYFRQDQLNVYHSHLLKNYQVDQFDIRCLIVC